MRPARKGPENPRRARSPWQVSRRFNEAGPQGAGKLDLWIRSRRRRGSFNEAGPQGAGKPW